MNRKKFIKTSILSATALAVLPHLSFTTHQQQFTVDQLIGKGNPDIVGDSYTSKMHKEAKKAFLKMKFRIQEHLVSCTN